MATFQRLAKRREHTPISIQLRQLPERHRRGVTLPTSPSRNAVPLLLLLLCWLLQPLVLTLLLLLLLLLSLLLLLLRPVPRWVGRLVGVFDLRLRRLRAALALNT